VSAAREDDTSKDSASSISKSGMNGPRSGFCERPVACQTVAVLQDQESLVREKLMSAAQDFWSK